MGGIYALISVGLSLQYGVARVLNIAHGEFIMIGAFATWFLYTTFNINPLISLAIISPFTFIIGFILYGAFFKKIRILAGALKVFEGNSMLACFGLLFIIQNLAILIWGADMKGYTYLAFPIDLFGAKFSLNRLLTLGFSITIGLIFFLFLSYTRIGKAIRASSQDPEAAELMGVKINQVLALCFALGALMAGISGTLISMAYHIHANMGLEYTIIALIVIVLGGLGNIPGSFFGGFLLGLVGSIVTYIEPGLALVAYYVIFMLLLLLRPTGIFGRIGR